VLPISSLGSAARGSASQVSIFYAQSGSIIAYMIDVLGEDKFGDFLEALATDTLNGALETVYGFDQLGLENAWREAVGLPEIDAAGGSTGSSSEPVPTLVPFGSGQSSSPQATAEPGVPDTAVFVETDDDGGSSNALPIFIGVLAIFALAAGGLYIRSTRS
jgi:hypothetical protein